ncbi:MAG: UDP-glucose/GDP-mannose dehydrogenase family protein [Alphaproteobacteria bacterium]|nr:UDP-glucose/GDP-mannose dehydrogenase family protein [Alphaproteobacteria bacterium]
MRIGVVGTGYVGLVSGTCFAEFGVEVVCLDTDVTKIEGLRNGIIPIYEPGLDDLVEKQVKAGRLSFTTDIKEAVRDVDAVFIAVGTPPRKEDGHADLTYVYQAARDVAKNIEGYTVVVTKSTVPVGTAREVERIMKEANPNAEFDVCSNPEFLREGAAITDFMHPDRVVVGTESKRAEDVMRELYRPLYLNQTPIVFVAPETSELIKYASNAFLATKITFINEIADLCEKSGANVQDVARAMGMDGRIGGKFLHAGPGYGGSCFPKDTLALAQTGQKLGARQTLVEQVVAVNAARQKSMAQRIIDACGGDVKGKKIGILGVSFKPNTDDVRDAPSLVVIPMLQEAGAQIVATDPAAMEEAEKKLSNVEWKDEPYDVTEGADCLVIMTEWNEFRSLQLDRVEKNMKTPVIVDLRNIYSLEEMKDRGFKYVSIGRKEVDGTKPSLSAVAL